MVCIPNQIYSGSHTENRDMGGACSTYGEGERCIQGFDGETLGKETTW
jgi:hypothetical protein